MSTRNTDVNNRSAPGKKCLNIPYAFSPSKVYLAPDCMCKMFPSPWQAVYIYIYCSVLLWLLNILALVLGLIQGFQEGVR